MSTLQVKSFIVPAVNAAKGINNTLGVNFILKEILPIRNHPLSCTQMRRGGHGTLATATSPHRFFSTKQQQDETKEHSSSSAAVENDMYDSSKPLQAKQRKRIGRRFKPSRSLLDEPFRLSPIMDFDNLLSRNSFFSDPSDDWFLRNPLIPQFTFKRQLENYMDNELQQSKIQMDFSESENQYLLNADLPGIKKEDIHIEVEDNILSIQAERKMKKETTEQKIYHQESYYGMYSRTISLPKDADLDSIDAKFENGVLHLTIDKLPPDSDNGKKKIEIKK